MRWCSFCTSVNRMLFVGQVKGSIASFMFSVSFNYSVVVKINVSNGYCLKQGSQSILLMLILADKLKFFCVASFTCCKHLQLHFFISWAFLHCLQIIYIHLMTHGCFLDQVRFKSIVGVIWCQTTNLNFELGTCKTFIKSYVLITFGKVCLRYSS